MIIFAIIGAIVGMVLGLRFRVLALIPAILVVTLAVIAVDHQSGYHFVAILLTALATIGSLQMGYMVGCIIRAKAARYPPARSGVHYRSARTAQTR